MPLPSRSFVVLAIVFAGVTSTLGVLVTRFHTGLTDTPGPAALTVELLGEAGRWHVRYPGTDQILGTADDMYGGQELHLPARTPVRLELRSADAIYFLRVPPLGVNQAAVPDLAFASTFTTGAPGEYEVRQDAVCGRMHPDLAARLIVESPRAFARWTGALAGAGARPTPGSGFN